MQYNFERNDKLHTLSEIFIDIYEQIYKKILLKQSNPTKSLPFYEEVLKTAFRASFMTGAAYNLMHLTNLNDIESLDESSRQEEIKLIQIAIFIHEFNAVMKVKQSAKSLDLIIYHYLHERLGISHDKADKLVVAILNIRKSYFGGHNKVVYFENETHLESSHEAAPLDPASERLRLAIQYGEMIEMYAGAKKYDMKDVELVKNEKIGAVTKTLYTEDKVLHMIPNVKINTDPEETINNLAQIIFDKVYTEMTEKAPTMNYLYHNGQSAKLEEIPEKEQKDVLKAFFFKTIRADESNFWATFVHSLVDGEPAEMRDAGIRKRWTTRLTKDHEYEMIPTDKAHPLRTSRWSEDEKRNTTRHQSVSYANPAIDYLPEAFGHDSRALLVGISCPPGGINLISMYDQGTISRPKDKDTFDNARDYVESNLNKGIYFKTLESLEQEGITDQSKHNEILARLKWVENDDDYKILIFTDNIESRLTAQARAWDLHCAVVDRRIKLGLPVTGHYCPKIMFYPSLNEYTKADQEKDLDNLQDDLILKQLIKVINAISHGTDLGLDQGLNFITTQGHNFSKHLTRALVERHLDEFFKRYQQDKKYFEYNFQSIVRSLPLSKIISVLKDNTDPLQADFIKLFVTDRSQLAFILSMIPPNEWESLLISDAAAKTFSTFIDIKPFFSILPPAQWPLLLRIKPFSDVNAINNEGKSHVELAIESQHIDYLIVLLEAGANLPSHAEEKAKLLNLAAIYGQVKIAKKCLESSVELSDTFFIALQNENPDFVEDLLEHLKDPNITNKNGDTLLALACESGFESLVKKLIAKGALLDKQDASGRTPLYRAMQKNQHKIVNMLLDLGANPSLCEEDGGSVLHLAAWDAGLKLIKKIVDKGVDLNAVRSDLTYTNFNESTPLHLVLRVRNNSEDQESIANYLIAAGASIHVANAHGDTALSLACYAGLNKLVDKLIALGAKVNGEPNQSSPLHQAAAQGNLDLVQKLIALGANLNAINAKNQTPILLAMKNGHYKLAEYLIKQGSDLGSRNNQKTTILHLAAEKGKIELINTLLSHHEVDINAVDEHNNTALNLAIKQHQYTAAMELVNKGANLSLINENGDSALSLACSQNCIPLIKLLLEKGAVVNSTNSNHSSPLHEACAKGQLTISQMLLKNGANINSIENKATFFSDRKNQTPLLTALNHGHPVIARYLMHHGASIDTVDKNLMTALHFACSKGYVDIVATYLEKGLDLNLQNNTGYAPIHLACKEGKREVVNLLLSKGANLHLLTQKQESPLYLAIQFGHKKIAEDLIKAGASLTDVTLEGGSPLHMVCSRGWVDLAEQMIAAGADPNLEAKDYMKSTPVMQAIKHEQFDLALKLCKKYPKILNTFLNPSIQENRSEPYHTIKFWGRITEALDPKDVYKVINTIEKLNLAQTLMLPQDFDRLFNGFSAHDLQNMIQNSKEFIKFFVKMPNALRSIYLTKVENNYVKKMIANQDTFDDIIRKGGLSTALELIDLLGSSHLSQLMTNIYLLVSSLEAGEHIVLFQKLGTETVRNIITDYYALAECLNKMSTADKKIFLNLLGADAVRELISNTNSLQHISKGASDEDLRYLWEFLGTKLLRELFSEYDLLTYVEILPVSSRGAFLDILGKEHIALLIKTKSTRQKLVALIPESYVDNLNSIFNDNYLKGIITDGKSLAQELKDSDEAEQIELLKKLGVDHLKKILGDKNVNDVFSGIKPDVMPKFLGLLGVEYLKSAIKIFPNTKLNIKNGAELGLILREFPDDTIKPFIVFLGYDALNECMPDLKHLFVTLSKIKPENRVSLLEALNSQTNDHVEKTSVERLISAGPEELSAMIIDLLPSSAQAEWSVIFKHESEDKKSKTKPINKV